MRLLDNPITNFLVNLWAVYIVTKFAVLALCFVLIGGYVLNGHYTTYVNNVEKYDIITAVPLVKLTSRDCTVVYNSDTNTVVKTAAGFSGTGYCSTVDSTTDIEYAIGKHHTDARGINDSSNFWFIVFSFVVFMIVAWLINPRMAYTLRGLLKVMGVWIIVSALLFPITYMDYKATSTQYLNGIEYTVTDGFMTKSGDWVPAPITFMGKITTVSTHTPVSM